MKQFTPKSIQKAQEIYQKIVEIENEKIRLRREKRFQEKLDLENCLQQEIEKNKLKIEEKQHFIVKLNVYQILFNYYCKEIETNKSLHEKILKSISIKGNTKILLDYYDFNIPE